MVKDIRKSLTAVTDIRKSSKKNNTKIVSTNSNWFYTSSKLFKFLHFEFYT